MNEADAPLTRDEKSESGGYDRVFAFLRDQLVSGHLKTGDRLLPERELAARLGASRPVLREVLRALAAIGVIEIRHGHGSVVRQPDFAQFGDVFTMMLAQKADAVDDIMEARIGIERQAIRLACHRARAGDIDRLNAALSQIEATVKDPVSGSEADFAFHQAMTAASHSPTLISLHAAIAVLLRRSHLGRRQRITDLSGIETYLVDHHRRLLSAILDSDIAGADRLIMQHFEIGLEYQRRARTVRSPN